MSRDWSIPSAVVFARGNRVVGMDSRTECRVFRAERVAYFFPAATSAGLGDHRRGLPDAFSRLNFYGLPLPLTFLVRRFVKNSRMTPSPERPATPIAKLVKTRSAPLLARG
jgi:hypothetical protein